MIHIQDYHLHVSFKDTNFLYGNKNRLDHEPFYQSNIERLLHLSPEDCKNEFKRLNITSNKSTNRNLET